MWILIIIISIVIVFSILFYIGSTASETIFRRVTNQWIANKQLGDISDEEIFNLILQNRYRVTSFADLPQRHKSIVSEYKDDIETGIAFYNSYSLTLTLYVIFLIENNKEYINSKKYGCVEDVFEAISSVIERQPNIKKYAEY
jgi:hypothetical protein